MPSVARIVIIGAGSSGIAAATKLLEAGFQNVVLLEAENRIGGRICTIPFGENVIDLGAQWCHGEKNNAVYETAQKFGSNILESTGNVYYDYKCIRSNKEILDENLAKQLKSIALKVSTERQEHLTEYEGSLGSYLTDKYWSELAKLTTPIDRIKAKEFFETYKKAESSIEAADNLFEVSGKGHLEYWVCEGDLLLNWRDKGYKTILELLMKVQPNKPWGVLEKRLLFNRRVENIEWLKKNEIKIRCQNGEIIIADHVICTTSLGVLKRSHHTLFTPSLPTPKIRAIEGLKFGTVNKFFLEFKEPFGPKDWHSICFLWLEEDLRELQNSPHFWLESVFGFYRVSYQPNLLQGWIIGSHARYMELLAEEEVLNALLWLLKKFLKFSIPQPINFTRTQWHSNNSFCGSYSFHSTYTDELRTGAWDLAAPLTNTQGKPRLQFAGEATHNHYFSTVHGAIETGWREAQRLIDFYRHVPAQL